MVRVASLVELEDGMNERKTIVWRRECCFTVDILGMTKIA